MVPTAQMLYFASAKDAAGGLAEEELRVPDKTSLATLRDTLRQRSSDLNFVLERCAFSLNEEIVLEGEEAATIIHQGDVVALIPPVSGG